MFTQAELETFLAIGIVLICLAASANVYWILNGWPFGKPPSKDSGDTLESIQEPQIDAIRRAFARWVWRWEKDHRVESYVKGLRALANDDSYNKTYTNPDTEQITFNRKKARN